MDSLIFKSYSLNKNVDTSILVTFLQEVGILKRRSACRKCGHEMSLVKSTKAIDGCLFQCSNCYTRLSIRAGGAFALSRLELHSIISIITCFCLDRDVTETGRLSGCGRDVIISWFKRLRRSCGSFLQDSFTKLGSRTEGHIVEIDETLISKRKYNRGRIKRQQWMFGAIERGTNNFIIKKISSRGQAELKRVILETITEGATINSDMWSSYMFIFGSTDSTYSHFSVNHTQNFVNPETGAHTQCIESLWSRLKGTLKKKKQYSSRYLEEYIDEYCFRAKLEKDSFLMFKILLNYLV